MQTDPFEKPPRLTDDDKRQLLDLMNEHGGDKAAVAHRLGISVRALYKRLHVAGYPIRPWGRNRTPDPDSPVPPTPQ